MAGHEGTLKDDEVRGRIRTALGAPKCPREGQDGANL